MQSAREMTTELLRSRVPGPKCETSPAVQNAAIGISSRAAELVPSLGGFA